MVCFKKRGPHPVDPVDKGYDLLTQWAMASSEHSAAQEPSAPKAAEPSFDKALQELEQVVRALEDGKIPLEDAIRLYARGQELCRCCTSILNTAQTRIEQIQKQSQELQSAVS